jgi:GAF domain-containing protein
MERTPSGHGDDERSVLEVGAPTENPESDLDRKLWRQFAEAATPKAFCQSWLSLQCRLLNGVRCAMVLLGAPDQGPFTPVAFWPSDKHNMTHLTGTVERTLKERRGLITKGSSSSESPEIVLETYHVAYPVKVSSKLHGVVVLEVEHHARHEIQTLMRQLHWGAAWLEALIRRTEALKSSEVNERLHKVLDLVASAVEHGPFHEAAMAFVTRLATELDCDRVSLGFVKGRHVRVKILSHTAEFGKATNLVRAIGASMDEALDQRAVVTYPQAPEDVPLVTRSHEELARQHGAGVILTIPLENKDRFIGGLTLERPSDKPFDQATIEACETAGALVSPILDTKRAEDRWLIRKTADSFVTQLKRMLGPDYLLRKLILLLLFALVTFFSIFEVDYRISAPTSIEGAIQRVVASPFNSYIKEAPVRPGDIVREGDLLCLLDDRDLKLERLKWTTEKEQFVKQYHEAMAKHDRAQIRIVQTKMDQAKAQIALLDEQLARTRMVAPFSGVIMSGDLSQSLGAPVERGQVLFEVAPLDEYRVIAEVDERDIQGIEVGQRSELVLPSMPGEIVPFVINKITPVSTAKEGRNYFRVEGKMEEASTRLRPGMEGVSKITIDRRKLIWVWTHKAIDWLRLQVWRWFP